MGGLAATTPRCSATPEPHGARLPLLRAAMCTLMRDISTNIAIMDMMRGAPSIYMLYLGYDEVAHHSGPVDGRCLWRSQRLDHTFARLRHVVKEKAPRPYDLIILSDHGQSFGANLQTALWPDRSRN